MREIKFRAWDKEDEEYISWYQLTHTRYNQDYLREHGDPEGPFLSMMTDKYIQLEQFTGLRDKNGREIYEGDIVSIVRYGGELQTKGDIFEESGVFRVRNGYEVADTNILGQFSAKIIEVVGNIHENPELLK